MTKIPTNWPFPIVNGVRTPESQALMDSKTQPTSNVELERKQILAEAEEALF